MFFFEYTLAFKRKSTQNLTDLPEVEKKFSFPLLRKRTVGAQFDSSFWHQVLLMCWTKSIHCLDSWQTAAAVCPTWFFLLLLKLWWLILLASCQYLLCSWNILRFPGLIIVLNLHYIDVSSHLIYSDNLAGRVKRFFGL